MITELTDFLTQQIYDHPKPEIYLADALTDFHDGTGGTLQTHIYLDSLNLRAAPEIDSANLTIYHGAKINIGQSSFSASSISVDSLQDKAIKIVIPDTTLEGGESEVEIAKRTVTWFGLIDTVTTEGVSVGKLLIQAVGVLKLAEKHKIYSSHCMDQAGADTQEVEVGLPFNVDVKNYFGVTGNRSVTKRWKLSAETYVFSYESRGRDRWTAKTAVEYLLAWHPPNEFLGIASPEWVVDTQTATDNPADWYDCHIDTDGKSLKELLDELIPRKRALSYYVSYDDVKKKIVLRMFTFVASDLLVSSEGGEDKFIKANTNKFTVALQESIWIENDATVIHSIDQKYDQVIARGERCTSTCTLTFDDSDADVKHFIKDWTTAEEDLFKDASSTTNKDANSLYRSEDRRKHVYCRFRIADEFNGRDLADNFVDPLLDQEGEPRQPYNVDTNPLGHSIRVRGLRLMRQLPLMDRVDYSGNNLESLAVQAEIEASVSNGDGASEYIPPIVIAQDPVTSLWVHLDQFSASTGGSKDASVRRTWSCNLHVAKNEPSVELRVSNGRQTLIAKADFLTPAPLGVYDNYWDPERQNGIDYRTIQATICIEFERRLEVSKKLGTSTFSRPDRILNLEIKDARLDYLVPDTVVALGAGVRFTSDGGYLRDDRGRVKSIVNATAEWYGRTKRAVSFSYKQPRRLMNIGDLITEVDGIGLTADINTPVTSITYTFPEGNKGGSTKIETGFAEVDFV